jgi:hypothetical protein
MDQEHRLVLVLHWSLGFRVFQDYLVFQVFQMVLQHQVIQVYQQCLEDQEHLLVLETLMVL